MIYAKNHKTGYPFDLWGHLSPKQRKLIEKSWADLFGKHILYSLTVYKIVPLFTVDLGRSTKKSCVEVVAPTMSSRIATDGEPVWRLPCQNLTGERVLSCFASGGLRQ